MDEVHEEAERLEHAMSPVLEERMLAAIGDAKTCPHGHPIDSRDRIDGYPLADVQEGAEVTILRFENEAEDLLHYLRGQRSRARAVRHAVQSGDDEVVVDVDGRQCTVTRSVAETVSVLADPAPPQRRATLPEALVFGDEVRPLTAVRLLDRVDRVSEAPDALVDLVVRTPE